MTAWSKLIEGSTLVSGTAWEHLNAQGGGTTGDVYIVDAGSAELSSMVLTGEVRVVVTAADVVGGVSASIAQSILEGSVYV